MALLSSARSVARIYNPKQHPNLSALLKKRNVDNFGSLKLGEAQLSQVGSVNKSWSLL